MKKFILTIIKGRNEQKIADRLSFRSAGVVENFNEQVVEIDTINGEIMVQVESIDRKIQELTTTKARLIDMHEKNTKVQNSIKNLIS